MAKSAKGERKQSSERGESISGYFRPFFKENPKLLNERSNQQLLQRWLDDHPGETEVPTRVKQGLANLKSVLRKNVRRRGRRQTAEKAQTGNGMHRSATSGQPETRARGSGLEVLEEHIDDCLSMAKDIDREGLESVINLLRRARNEVVWKMGQ